MSDAAPRPRSRPSRSKRRQRHRVRGRSVRARAALAAVLALTPVLVGAAVAGVLVQRSELTRATALVAEEQARVVAGDIPDATDREAPSASLGGEETLVQVISANGSVVDASSEVDSVPALLSAPQTDQVLRGRVENLVAGEDDTYLTVAVSATDGGYVVAARSLESVDAATASTTRLFATGVPALVALVAALSWILAGRALRPVESLSSRAAQITAAGADARLPDVSTGDEVERLATTLNQMLSRLDVSARSQRQFVADASHELRSPIATIRTVVEVAATTSNTDWDEVSRDVLTETARLERLVTGLLVLARRDIHAAAAGTDFETVDLAALVSDELRRPRRLDVRATSLEDPVLVRGNREALASVVTNLVDNADRHGHSLIAIELTCNEGDVDLTVSDDGGGIPDHETERVFERFVRLDAARARDTGGTGLGLPIARAIAHDHGGTLTASPSDEQGGAGLHLHLQGLQVQQHACRRSPGVGCPGSRS